MRRVDAGQGARNVTDHRRRRVVVEGREHILAEARFGGVVLSQATNTSALASMNVTQIEPALDRIVVSH